MNTCKTINSIAIGKLFKKKYIPTQKFKRQVILLSQIKITTWPALHILSKELKLKDT
jgi:hypothetical protein